MERKALRILALVAAVSCSVAAGAMAQPIGAIDTPTEGQTVSGVVRVSGFVLDMNAVDKVEVLVDGAAVNTAQLYLPRIDVLQVFPTYAGSPTAQPGFITSFLAPNYANGPHTVAIRVTESATQAQTIVASVGVVVDNTVNQAPFGYIDIPSPVGLTGANGSFPVYGWALDDNAINHVDVLIDGQQVSVSVGVGLASPAIYGLPRADVQAAFPDVPNSLDSGFNANIDTIALVNGIHILSVWAWDNQGLGNEIGERTIQVINNGQNLAPFGDIDFPLDKASLLCTSLTNVSNGYPSPCTPELCGTPSLIPNFVDGWALDVGARLDMGQVAYVELLLDGQIVANTRTDCMQLGQALTNCYGINRPDIARQYTGYVNADNSGFSFTFYLLHNDTDLSGTLGIYLPTTDLATFGPVLVGFTVPGKHTIAIRAGDEEETVSQFSAMSVDILCDETTNADQPAFGFIDDPVNFEQISGNAYQVFGWAYDLQGVQSVEVDVDGQVVGTATYGLYRPDVPLQDPRVRSANVGFSFVLDTTQLANTQHDIVVYVIDRGGHRTEIGRRKAVVNNNVATH
ncbi:MAG: Ig-like domain-containing protein [Syntrophomonadaceae bacterium]